MVVERPGPHQIALLALDDLFGDPAEILIRRHQALRVEVFFLVGGSARISGLLQALHLVADLDLFAAVRRASSRKSTLLPCSRSGKMLCFPGAWMDFISTVWNESEAARGSHMRRCR